MTEETGVFQGLYLTKNMCFADLAKVRGQQEEIKGDKKKTHEKRVKTTTTTTLTDNNEAGNRSRNRSHDMKTRLSKPIPHKIPPFQGSNYRVFEG